MTHRLRELEMSRPLELVRPDRIYRCDLRVAPVHLPQILKGWLWHRVRCVFLS